MAERDPLKEIEGLTDLPQAIDVDLSEKDDKGGKEEGKERRAAADAGKEPVKEDDNIVALRRELAAQTRARQAAEARAQEVEAQRQRAEAQTAEGQLKLINNSLDGATANLTRAKADLKAALANGEHDAAVEAQIALNDAQIKIEGLTRGKGEMEARAEREKQERDRRPEPRVHADPIEAMASSLSPRSAQWVRANPDCVTDPRKNRQMIRAHEDAVDDGISVDTPEYFAFIEKKLGIGHDDGGEPTQRTPPRRQASADAPVSRSGNGDGQGSRRNTVTLTPAQRQFCDESKIKYEDYARNLVALKTEGRLQ